MKCPKCNSTHSRVVDSRHADEAMRLDVEENVKIAERVLQHLNILKLVH